MSLTTKKVTWCSSYLTKINTKKEILLIMEVNNKDVSVVKAKKWKKWKKIYSKKENIYQALPVNRENIVYPKDRDLSEDKILWIVST